MLPFILFSLMFWLYCTFSFHFNLIILLKHALKKTLKTIFLAPDSGHSYQQDTAKGKILSTEGGGDQKQSGKWVKTRLAFISWTETQD